MVNTTWKGTTPKAIRSLINDSIIGPNLVSTERPSTTPLPTRKRLKHTHREPKDDSEIGDDNNNNNDGFGLRLSLRLLVSSASVHDVKQRAAEIGLPLLQEYTFRADRAYEESSEEDNDKHKDKDLQIGHVDADTVPSMYLKVNTKLRSYQSQALNEVFGHGSGRVRSGVVVLPCGAGKTLTGITAACTVRKPVLVLTTNTTSVRQWGQEFRRWTDIPSSHIRTFTAASNNNNNKDTKIPNNCVLVSTYQMISHSGQRSDKSKAMIDIINSRTFGMLLLDEVHVVPASEYSRAVQSIKARVRLGFTATMIREDDKITDLRSLVGPTLYMANWKHLAAQGYLANVRCIEAPCSMPRSFMQAYEDETLRNGNSRYPNSRTKLLLCGVNPRKLNLVEMLVRHHEQNGDKIIVFSDSIFTLEVCAKMLGRPYLYGKTSDNERQDVLDLFRKDTYEIQTICLSKVGDVAIDLPKANVVIQVAADSASRRAEAQRLGRILRPKFREDVAGDGNGNRATNRSRLSFDAVFYTLFSAGTAEESFSNKRQQFLIDQGYSYERMENLCDRANTLATEDGYTYASPADHQELLRVTLDEIESRDEPRRASGW